MEKITAWEWWNPKKKIWEHHHIEDGWSKSDSPKPLFENQKKAWKNAKFQKEHMYLSDDNIVVEKGESRCPSIRYLMKLLRSTASMILGKK
jgi:hypothetical protein